MQDNTVINQPPILVIDDTVIFRMVLISYFQMAGWEVFQAEDCASGMQAALQHQPGFIICDMFMPNGDGPEVCRQLQAEPRLKDTKVIMYSGNSDLATRQAAFDAGAVAYVLKPAKLDDVMDLVHFLNAPHSDWETFKSPRIFLPGQNS